MSRPQRLLSLSAFCLSFLLCAVAAPAFTTPAVPAASPTINNCPALPPDNVWNRRIDDLPVAGNSDTFITTIGTDTNLHPDFGAGFWEGEPIGMFYITVPGNQPKVAMTFGYDDQSDPGPYPFPTDAPMEGGPTSTGDRHVLVLDRDNCKLYETWSSYPQADGSWQAGSGAIFDLNSNAFRPDTWTSADAAGLPILVGLARYDEVAAGEVAHALRFTARCSPDYYIWPARHQAQHGDCTNPPPMGLRVRLKNSYDISGYPTQARVLLQAMKTYGLILADNGSDWYISGLHDERWDDGQVNELKNVPGSAFEVVDTTSLIIDPNSGQARQPIVFTPTAWLWLPMIRR